MGNFKQGGEKRFARGSGSGGGFERRGGDRSNFKSDSREHVMFHAVCDQCGKPCELPFRPTGDRPVYCSSCFEKKREVSGSRGGDRFSKNKFSGQKTDFKSSSGGENNDELKKQLVMLNGKMDQLIKAVEAMANTKSIEKKPVENTPIVKIKKLAKKKVSKEKKS